MDEKTMFATGLDGGRRTTPDAQEGGLIPRVRPGWTKWLPVPRARQVSRFRRARNGSVGIAFLKVVL
jgi:hypothetical protein